MKDSAVLALGAHDGVEKEEEGRWLLSKSLSGASGSASLHESRSSTSRLALGGGLYDGSSSSSSNSGGKVSGGSNTFKLAFAISLFSAVLLYTSFRLAPDETIDSYTDTFWKHTNTLGNRINGVTGATRSPTAQPTATDPPATDPPAKGTDIGHECSAGAVNDVALARQIDPARFESTGAVRISILRDAYCVRVHFTVLEKQKLESYDASCPLDAPKFAIAYENSKRSSSWTEGKANVAVATHAGCYVHKDDLRPLHYYVAVLGQLDAGAEYSYSIHQVDEGEKISPTPAVDKTQEYVYATPLRSGSDASSKRLGKPAVSAKRVGRPSKYLVIGDMDTSHFNSVVDTVAGNDEYSMFLHLGDASYASNSGECYSGKTPGCRWDCPLSDPTCRGRNRAQKRQLEKWNLWWTGVEAITSSVVTMSTPGNHDNDLGWFYSFHPPLYPWFPGRFDAKRDDVDKIREKLLGMNTRDQQAFVNDYMANDMEFYSFDYGLVHFVSMSTEDNPINAYEKKETPGKDMEPENEARFAAHFGTSSPQYRFIKNDLMSVDRSKTPWVVVFTHRPLYHSSTHHPSCDQGGDWFGCAVRETYDPLFADAGVNLVLSGHSHHYQRSSPIVRGEALEESAAGPRYMICGVGGYALSKHFRHPQPPWVAVRTGEHFGHCMFDVRNATAMRWQFFAAENGHVVDEAWIQR